MASSGSDHVDYDDDFEEASDEDAGPRKNLHGTICRATSSKQRKVESEVPVDSPAYAEISPSRPPVPAATSPPAEALRPVPDASLPSAALSGLQASAPLSSRPERDDGRRTGRRKPDEEPRTPPVAVRSTTEDMLEMNTSGGSFTNSTGRRPVRAKISVGGGSDNEPKRPGTGDSLNKAADSRPIWLQSSEGADRPLRSTGSQSGPRSLSENRGLTPPSSANGTPLRPTDAVSGGRGRPPMDPEFDADARQGTADGGDRKLKRLQQEIQRLEARLKDSELYSAQDEGLPIFKLDEVEIGVMIGQGGFCHVHQGMWRSTPCAIKKIFDPVLTDELKSEFENEVRMLRRLRHPNVITVMAVCRIPPALSFMTEFVAGGSLFELLHGPPKARRRDCIECEPHCLLPVMRQTSAALAYLHAMLVVHRDVKSHNLLLTPGQFPVAKLCDFGLARTKSELGTGTMQWAGTPCYMAPELFAKRKYNEGVDIFAFGVMLWEAMSTEMPHANLDPPDIAHKVQSKDGAGLPVTHAWPKSLKALLKALLAVQAEDRPPMTSASAQLAGIITEFPAPDS